MLILQSNVNITLEGYFEVNSTHFAQPQQCASRTHALSMRSGLGHACLRSRRNAAGEVKVRSISLFYPLASRVSFLTIGVLFALSTRWTLLKISRSMPTLGPSQ